MTLIDDLQRQIDQRLGELLPLVEEYAALRQLRTTIETLDPAAAAAELAAFADGAADDGDGPAGRPAASREAAGDAPAAPVASGSARTAAAEDDAAASAAAGARPRAAGRRGRRRSTAPEAPAAARKTRRPVSDGARTRIGGGADEVAPSEHLDDEQAEAAFAAIAATPGMTAAQLAAALDVPVSDLFRLLPQLQRDGRIRKQGKGYLPAEARS